MNCPNCDNKLKTTRLDGIELEHCSNCGSSFFDANEINRISLDSAKKLLKDKKTEFVSGKEKTCPRDSSPLKPLKDEAVPHFVNLLKCDKCGGVFAYPSDLVNFKKAQQAKLDFFKTWRTPLPSLKSVMVYGLILLASISTLFSFHFLRTKQTLQTQAEEVKDRVRIVEVNNQAVLYFGTEKPVKSQAIFRNKKTGEQLSRIINDHPATVHILRVKDIPLSPDYLVTVTLTSGLSKKETAPFPFVQN